MSLQPFGHDYFMKEALREAEKAFDKDEVPVGAVIAAGDRIIARGHNLTEQLNDVTAHAEMQAFTAASDFLGGKYLTDCTLYVTLEPCPMCAGAAFWTQIPRLVFGASDPKRGYRRMTPDMLHPRTEVIHGIMAEDCAAILIRFFEKKRR
ncbi:MAG: nucleoside deaminase [Flavobacteriales bacterium]|nr:nucleoside deaminase [Flavobacteriales bacterium]